MQQLEHAVLSAHILCKLWSQTLIRAMKDELPIVRFEHVAALREWLEANYATSDGIFVRIYKKHSGVTSVSFEDVLDEGLCFGWSESTRLKGDDTSYLQKFTPRKTKGTTSERNRHRASRFMEEGRMTRAGLVALGFVELADNP